MLRWLFGPVGRLPQRVRLGFFLVSLVVLGATFAATGSEGLQLLAWCVLMLGVLPVLQHRFGVPDATTETVAPEELTRKRKTVSGEM